MEAYDSLQDPYPATLDLKTSEHTNIYNKTITGLSASDKYKLTRSKWTDFYQYLEDYLTTFGFNAALQVVTARDPGNALTELNTVIHSYTSSSGAYRRSPPLVTPPHSTPPPPSPRQGSPR